MHLRARWRLFRRSPYFAALAALLLIGAGFGWLLNVPDVIDLAIPVKVWLGVATIVGAVMLLAVIRDQHGRLRRHAAIGHRHSERHVRTAQRTHRALDVLLRAEYDRIVDERQREGRRLFDPGLSVGPVFDVFRSRRYRELGVSENFKPDLEAARRALTLLADAFRAVGQEGLVRDDTFQQTSGMGDRQALNAAADETLWAYAPHHREAFRAEVIPPAGRTAAENFAFEMGALAERLEGYRDDL